MFENITVMQETRVLSTQDEVEAAETTLGTRFPTGYAEYVTTFGEGVLGGLYVRIYPPRRILRGDNNVEEWRARVAEYWFWPDDPELLTQERASECVIIGDTYDGDELVIHPSRPDQILVLPRDSERIHVAGDGLADAIEWLCNSGVLTESFVEREFEPFDSRQDDA